MDATTQTEPIPLRTVPDPDDPDCAQILVEAVVCGVVTPFVLDTGGRRSALAPSPLVDRLPQLGTETSGGVFGSVSSELVRVPELRLGPIALAHAELTVAERHDDHNALGLGRRNLLGMDVLRVRPWELRFSEGTLWVDPPPGEALRYPLVSNAAGHIYLDARFDEVTGTCVWDTGAGITVVDAGFARAHPELLTMFGMGTGTDSNLTTLETPLAMLAGCRIGEVAFSPSKVAIVDLGPANASTDLGFDLILGYPIIRQADWYVDVPGREWSVRPANATDRGR